MEALDISIISDAQKLSSGDSRGQMLLYHIPYLRNTIGVECVEAKGELLSDWMELHFPHLVVADVDYLGVAGLFDLLTTVRDKQLRTSVIGFDLQDQFARSEQFIEAMSVRHANRDTLVLAALLIGEQNEKQMKEVLDREIKERIWLLHTNRLL